jgi:predicted MPP superfamily phosphohydrolase
MTLKTPLVTRRGLITAGAGLLVAGGAYGGYIEPSVRLDVTEYALTPPRWPADFQLSVAVVSDVHAGGPNMGLGRINDVVDLTNSLKPDLIVHLGDHEATHRLSIAVARADWAAALKRLDAPLGVYSILGNHDWWYHHNEVRAAVRSSGIPIMENDAVLLDRHGRKFWLAGIGDQIAYYIGPHQFRGVDDLPGTLAKVTTEDPVLLLVHEPDIFVRVPERVSLTLAGHTHGGQIHLPGLANPFIPSAYGARFRYGHIVEKGRHMIVSGGLGTSKIPVRIGVPPEVVLVRLGGAPAQGALPPLS